MLLREAREILKRNGYRLVEDTSEAVDIEFRIEFDIDKFENEDALKPFVKECLEYISDVIDDKIYEEKNDTDWVNEFKEFKKQLYDPKNVVFNDSRERYILTYAASKDVAKFLIESSKRHLFDHFYDWKNLEKMGIYGLEFRIK